MIADITVGGIVYTGKNDSLKYLIVTAKNSERWIFPKGKVDIFESRKTAVSREVEEEAGVNAELEFKLECGPYVYLKLSGKQQRIEMYAMKYLNKVEKWKEVGKRDRVWVSYSKAKSLLAPEFNRALEEVHSKLIKH